MEKTFTISGKIAPGPMRGSSMIHHFFYRLTSVMGFEPFKGTLDIKARNPVDLKKFATATLDKVLLDGSRSIDLYIAPVTLIIHKHEDYVEVHEKPDFSKKTLPERIETLKDKQAKLMDKVVQMKDMLNDMEIRHECFAIQEKDAIDMSCIEIIDKANLKEKFSLQDGDVVDIIFYELKKK